MKNIPAISVGNILELKKPHPCGCKLFLVCRIGSDIKITCTNCNRALSLERVKLEKMIKNIKLSGDKDEQN